MRRSSMRERRQAPLHRIHRPQRPRIHLQMLAVAGDNGFRFDTVQMPLNVMDAHYRSFERLVLPSWSRTTSASSA